MRSVLSASGRSLGEPHAPARQTHGQSTVLHQLIVKPAGSIRGALTIHVCVSQSKDFTPTHGVAKLICRPRTISAHLRLSALAFDWKMIDHVVDCLGGRHAPGMKSHIENDAHRSPEQIHQLKEAGLVSSVVLALTHELLGVKRPALDHDGGPDMPTYLGGE